MKLLYESIDEQLITPIIEAVEGKSKSYYLTGPFAEAVTTNRNGREYPLSVLQKAIADFMPMVEARRALGELNHPPSPQINPKEASHLIESLTWDNNVCVGKALILDTPNGKIIKAMMEANVRLGMSTRGVGSLSSVGGKNVVQGDYKLNTVDCVVDPSGISCFTEGIMEGAEWVYEVTTNS